MPTFNRAYVIWKAINSILAQSFHDWELIVVDDGSKDSTQRLLEEFTDPRIRVFKTDNHGPSAARNLGLSRARSELIAYLDSDNTWHPDFLAEFEEATGDDSENVVWYCGQETTHFDRSSEGTWENKRTSIDERSQYTLEEIWKLGAPDTSAMVHRLSVGRSVNGWDENCRWLEDWDFFLRICLEYPGRWRHIPKILLSYRQVHGAGADGICAEARQHGTPERQGRRYLFDKWKDLHPEIAETLGRG
jgi:glycosyltransferase involved in cell wall biosynthesis